MIKGENVLDALAQLEVMIKRPGSPVAKLLKSAVANAENKSNMVSENLYVKSIRVDEGIKLKRFKPKGFGRVSPIEKKTSRIELILAEKVPGMKRTARSAAEVAPQRVERPYQEPKKEKEDFVPKVKHNVGMGTLGRKENILKSFGRRMFRRKAIG